LISGPRAGYLASALGPLGRRASRPQNTPVKGFGMVRAHRPRALAAGLKSALLLFAMTACDYSKYPNSTFSPHTEFGIAEDKLWSTLLFLGTAVFIFVEVFLITTIVKFRRKPGQKNPEHVHGNTTLEILWTVIPAVILVFIAVPTVRTIFKTQAKAVTGALQVEVYGHQWWWEFRYPQYTTRNAATGKLDTLTTANELYLPIGRTVNFALRTADVLHSFWIPQMGGKRDLIANHTNYLWYTPHDTTPVTAWNGSCNEYCGASHANMKFRAFTVTPAQFASWVAGQQAPAAYGAVVATPAPTAAGATLTPNSAPAGAEVVKARAVNAQTVTAGGATPNAAGQPAAGGQAAGGPTANATTAIAPATLTTVAYVFPREQLPAYTVPRTPTPTGLNFAGAVQGDAARGLKTYSASACIGCHMIRGNPMSQSRIGPNLTHVASRTTIAAGLYPNDREHLVRWIKNARAMKPGSQMPTLGLNEVDPITGAKVTKGLGGLTDQQIADIAAYLESLQ
jgi:cytochrome c oxidase subunit 2